MLRRRPRLPPRAGDHPEGRAGATGRQARRRKRVRRGPARVSRPEAGAAFSPQQVPRLPEVPGWPRAGRPGGVRQRRTRSMITAVDTNILLDVLIPGTPHGEESERALDEASWTRRAPRRFAGRAGPGANTFGDGRRRSRVPAQGGAPRRSCVATGAPRASSPGTWSRTPSSEPTPWSTPTGCSPETGATTAHTSPSWSWF